MPLTSIEAPAASSVVTLLSMMADQAAAAIGNGVVRAGVASGGEVRLPLASLDTRQQALIFGHALPMPVVREQSSA